jgi:signal transduction histidine kinase
MLFRNFVRLDPQKADGYGLGLSIVKKIIEKLGGTVGVESTGNGEGSKFFFILPANQQKSFAN